MHANAARARRLREEARIVRKRLDLDAASASGSRLPHARSDTDDLARGQLESPIPAVGGVLSRLLCVRILRPQAVDLLLPPASADICPTAAPARWVCARGAHEHCAQLQRTSTWRVRTLRTPTSGCGAPPPCCGA